MIKYEDPETRKHLLDGMFGLEEEGLRVYRDGHISHTPHPFSGDKHIVRDFCENQIEVNTSPWDTAEDAVNELSGHLTHIQKTLHALPVPELLWPFSNPPYINSGSDVPIADYKGKEADKKEYRKYLSDRYGRYIMTFSGIHVNYSLGGDLIKKSYEAWRKDPSEDHSRYTGLDDYSDHVYLDLAQKASEYGWILTAATAASPVSDSSFIETGNSGKTVFHGMSSLRGSELGYWNFFTPVFDYSSLESYTNGIQRYIEEGFLIQPSELYYPIRLKPPGENTLDSLKENGINHIELRMFDIYPFDQNGIEIKDVKFAQLLLVWLACSDGGAMTAADQAAAAANFKRAAHYDLTTVNITERGGNTVNAAEAAVNIISAMKVFYHGVLPSDELKKAMKILDFEEQKFRDPSMSYAYHVKKIFGKDFVNKGLQLAEKNQEAALK